MVWSFTDEEPKEYEYRQDLRYYYGTGPRTGLASTKYDTAIP